MTSNYRVLSKHEKGKRSDWPLYATVPSVLDSGLPSPDYLGRLCLPREGEVVLPRLEKHLTQPVEEFLERPSKNLRAALVHAGYLSTRCEDDVSLTIQEPLPADVRQNLKICCQVIEFLHAGSLIVDDVQDQSEQRRGLPCFHKMHGVAKALTAGNWLYIWPFRLIESLSASSSVQQLIRSKYIETLELAHYGQALDVSIRVDELEQWEVPLVSSWITDHKTGSVTALAFQMGAILGGADEDSLMKIASFGRQFGALLQNYDDLGNFLGHSQGSKKYEDLRERRSSWIWAIAAEQFDSAIYNEFIAAVNRLPDEESLVAWSESYQFLPMARKRTEKRQQKLQDTMDSFGWRFSESVKEMLLKLCERLSHAYTG